MATYIESDNRLIDEIFPQVNTQNDSDENVLMKISKIEENLKKYETVTVLFLLHRNARETYINLGRYLTGCKTNLIYQWCFQSIDTDLNWKKKFYESIYLIKNYKILKEFEILPVNAVHDFNHNYLIPNIRVELFKICENIVGDELGILLKEMGEYCYEHIDYLEMYLLKWVYEGKISIEDDVNLRLLINCLQRIGRTDLADRLRYYQCYQCSNELLPYPILNANNVGFCIIINQENFTAPNPRDPHSKPLESRIGTQKDLESLAVMLGTFKFNFEIIPNVISTSMTKMIRLKIESCFNKEIHSVFMLIILTHGDKDTIYGTDSKPLSIFELEKCLLIPKLNEKPKVIIIEACQGNVYLQGPAVNQCPTDNKIQGDNDTIEEDKSRNSLPPVKKILKSVCVSKWPIDTLFAQSCVPFFKSCRHPDKGTWYIQTICEIFQKYPDECLYTLLTRVSNLVMTENPFGTEKGIRLLPDIRSRLRKKLYLQRKV